MPTRVIRGEINASDSLSAVSMQADLTFRALIVACDDFGRIDGRLPALKALLFPLREEVTTKKLDAWLDELAAGPDAPIERYVVDGRPYIVLTGWEKHRGKSRRGSSSKCPEPLPRKSAEVHADPPVSRESGVESRESGIEIAAAAAPRKCLCPDRLSDEDRQRAREWSAANGFTDSQLAYAWARVRDWSRGKSEKRTDWLAVLRNAMSDGWALKGFNGSGPPPKGLAYKPAEDVLAEAKRRQAEDDARSRDDSPEAIGKLIDFSLRQAGGSAA